MFDFFQLVSWDIVAAGGGAIAGLGLLVQNLMTIKKLRMENQVLRQKIMEEDRKITLPTQEETEKYGRYYRELKKGAVSLMWLVIVGLISGFAYWKISEVEAQYRRLSGELARLEEAYRNTGQDAASPVDPQVPKEMNIVQGFGFVLEGCVSEGNDLNCWIIVTNRHEHRDLRVFVDGSRLEDQNDRSYNVKHVLEHDGGRELNLLKLDLSSEESYRFGLHFAGLGSSVGSIKLLVVRAEGFDLEWRDVEVRYSS